MISGEWIGRSRPADTGAGGLTSRGGRLRSYRHLLSFVGPVLIVTLLATTVASSPPVVAPRLGASSPTLVTMAQIHSENGSGGGPNVTLHATNGNLTLAAALFYNATPTQFAVSAMLTYSGGTAPYTLRVGFGSGIAQNLTLNSSTGSASASYNYSESGEYGFSAYLVELANYAWVGLSTNITAVAPLSPLELTVADSNSTTHGLPTTEFDASLAGGEPPYAVVIDFGDGAVSNESGLYFLGAPSSSPSPWLAQLAFHAYASVAHPTVYHATVTLTDALGAQANETVAVAPNYNYPTGGGGTSGPTSRLNLNASNGSLFLSVVVQLTAAPNPCGCDLFANVSGSLTGGTTPYNGSVMWGDGGFSNLGPSHNLTSFDTTHDYTSPGNVTLSVSVSDGNGTFLGVHALIVVPQNSSGTNHSGGSNGTSSHQVIHLSSTNGSLGLNITVWLNETDLGNLSHGLSYLNFTAQGYASGAPSSSLNVSYGDGGFAVYYLVGNVSFVLSHTYTFNSPTTFNWTAVLRDTNGSQVELHLAAAVPLSSGGHGGGPPPPPPYPTAIAVVVAATPVSGVAPLNVTLSAYLSGGSPPFQVVWSLPIGNATTLNRTGLEATVQYTSPGWYPATAFVYNTTSSYGTVLVGYGSVWVYVAAPHFPGGPGSGTNNTSGNGSHDVRTPGGISAIDAAASNPMFVAFLVAIGLGAGVGGIVGYSFGHGRGPRTREPPPGGEAPVSPPK